MDPRNTIGSVVVLALLCFLVTLVNTETVADSALTSKDSQDTSGDYFPSDVTTKDPFHQATGEPVTHGYEDATHTQTLDEEEDALGPGAITAIVVAVFLGVSVLIALIVITFRKFTAS